METGFIWKGVHSSEKGLKIISLPNITTPEKREDKIIVPGRSGYLTIDDDSYEGEVKTVEFDIKHNNFDDIKSWLNGSGEVIFSNEPDRYYKARIVNKLDLARVLEKFHSGIVQFDCQPFGYAINQKPITWNKELLEGLSGNTYDLEKIYYVDKQYAIVTTENGKQYIKYNNPTLDTMRLTSIKQLKKDEVYTYTFAIRSLSSKTIKCVNCAKTMYGLKEYNIHEGYNIIHHTFKAQYDMDIFHIQNLDKYTDYYFSDFRLIEGNTEGENLILDTYNKKGSNSEPVICNWSLKDTNNFLKGQTITISVDLELKNMIEGLQSRIGCEFSIKFKDDTYLYLGIWHTKAMGDFKGRLSKTFTLPNKDIALVTTFNLYANLCKADIAKLEFSKIEFGNKATPWNMSPLDKEILLENLGTRKSKPTITIEGTGDINLYINKETIKLTNVEDKITINSDLMEAYKDTMPCNNKMYGEFPVLEIGSNNITWTGNVNRIEVEKNTVFL